MNTILHQGQPTGAEHWIPLPNRFVAVFERLGYGLRELVLRADAEREQELAFNRGIQCAAELVQQSDPKLAARILAMKLKTPKVRG